MVRARSGYCAATGATKPRSRTATRAKRSMYVLLSGTIWPRTIPQNPVPGVDKSWRAGSRQGAALLCSGVGPHQRPGSREACHLRDIRRAPRGSHPRRGGERALRRHHCRRRDLRHVPAPPAARPWSERARVRGGGGRGRHLVLEPLPRGAVRFRELDLRLLLLRGDPPRVGVERALRRAAGDTALLQLRGRQARPPARHRVQPSDHDRHLRRGRPSVGGRERRRAAGAGTVPDHGHRAPVGPDHAEPPRRRDLARGVLPPRDLRTRACETCGGSPDPTGTWPQEPVSFVNKRVAVIGTGATGVQAITEIAKTVGHLTVFQRTPNWCAPLHNRPIDAATQARIKATYPETFAICRESFGCFIHQADPRNALEVSPEEREALFEKLYGEPGFGIWMGNFRDVLIDREANGTITEFMRGKIRQRVKDPALAKKLIPTNHGFGTRRVPRESGYYEASNQSNVRPVDVRETPIERITPAGVKTSEGEHEVDMIIYATGFDAITGAFDRIDVRGRGGRRLRDKWAEGPRTYLGLQIEGFPILFTLVG